MKNKARRLILSIFCLTVVLIGLLAFYSVYTRIQSRQRYEANCYATGVFEDDSEELKNKAIKACEEVLKLCFPEYVQLMYANADKGDLFGLHTLASFKFMIPKEKRYEFEVFFESSVKKRIPVERSSSFDLLFRLGPQKVWKPDLLINTTRYAFDLRDRSGWGGEICVGEDASGAVYVYLFYGV